MLDELSADTQLFMELDREVLKLCDALHNGEEEPLIDQRKPKKEETVVEVFAIPTESGRKILLFQSEDSVLWQFCDAGARLDSLPATRCFLAAGEGFRRIASGKDKPPTEVSCSLEF